MTLIIPHFNQFSYCLHLIAWWNLYVPGAKIIISDNGSTIEVLRKFTQLKLAFPNLVVVPWETNEMRLNLERTITEYVPDDYYFISNPDILPAPGIPENFIDILKHCIDEEGYNRAGFALRINDLPDHYPHKADVIAWEKQFWRNLRTIHYRETEHYSAYLAALDLSLCLYSKVNGGWKSKSDGWGNSIRMFDAIHWQWYERADSTLPEVALYNSTCLGPADGKMKGVNHWNPDKPLDEMLKA